MVEITGRYQGNLHCSVRHGPSGSVLQTDAPRDNQGQGEAFSPTDLVATALGTCIATTMAIAARKHGVELRGLSFTVRKEMAPDLPRRIGRLVTEVRVPLPVPCTAACTRISTRRLLFSGSEAAGRRRWEAVGRVEDELDPG